jgi:hypothetical protein
MAVILSVGVSGRIARPRQARASRAVSRRGGSTLDLSIRRPYCSAMTISFSLRAFLLGFKK